MRKINTVQVVVLILCLVLTGVLVAVRPVSNTTGKSVLLAAELSRLSNKYKIEKLTLSPRVVEALKLDDYIFQTYTKNDVPVSLYVGYYFSGKKVGAAHDPQVCYPGQGWKLSNKESGHYELKNGEKIKYSTIIAELAGKKELIIYWFQVDDETANNTFLQKMILFKKKIMRQGESNAFVRISTSLDDTSPQNAKEHLMSFIDDFYPLFLKYVEDD